MESKKGKRGEKKEEMERSRTEKKKIKINGFR